MERISSDLKLLADEWSPVILKLLNDMGMDMWPARKIKRSLLAKAQTVIPYSVEGPLQQGSALMWSLFHTSRPSTFNDRGSLQPGERSYWLLVLEAGFFKIEGAQILCDIPATVDALTQSLSEAARTGPQIEAFYGNKGPLSHPARSE